MNVNYIYLIAGIFLGLLIGNAGFRQGVLGFIFKNRKEKHEVEVTYFCLTGSIKYHIKDCPALNGAKSIELVTPNYIIAHHLQPDKCVYR